MARNFTVITRTSPSTGQPRVTFVNSSNLRTLLTVRHVDGLTFLLSLRCDADDLQVPAYEQVLDSVGASISLTPTTAASMTPTP
jgi:hypothetical protein